MKPVSQSSLTCSTRDAARLLGVSVRTAQLWVEDGRLRAWKTPGGHRRILVESLEHLLDQQRKAGLPGGRPSFGVLLMREDEGERKALQSLLETWLPGCTVSAAASGFEVLIQIGKMSPDVVITDLGVSGLDFFRMMHALGGRIRDGRMQVVVLLAAGSDREVVGARMPEGVVLVDPPFDGAELSALIWDLLSSRNDAVGAS